MARIAKGVYFAGLFRDTVINSSKGAPMICEATDHFKRVVFETELGEFNVYVKYSTAIRNGWDMDFKPKKRRVYWTVSFTDSEYNYLLCDFEQKEKMNLIAIVCSDSTMSSNFIAILKIKDALFYLKKTTKGGSRSITISRTGNKHTFDCSGVGLPRKMKILQVPAYVNHLRFFDANCADNKNKQLVTT